MKTALAGIPALSDGVIAELYTIALKNGDVYYRTSGDIDLSYGGHDFKASVAIERGAVRQSEGIEVDTCDVTIHHQDGNPLSPLLASTGGFDMAKIKIIRARKTYSVWMFEGLVVDAPKYDRTQVTLTISDPKILLNIQMPRNVYCAGCIWNLYGPGCGLNKNDFYIDFTVASGSTKQSVKSDATEANDYFTLGMITFQTGLNAGITRTVKDYFQTDGRFALSVELPFAVSAGDIIRAYPGCNKSLDTCTNKFSNAANFRGQPYMPVPEDSV